MMNTIYWDYNATAPVRPLVKERVRRVLDELPGNPSSMHRLGQESKAYVESVRRKAAQAIGIKPTDLIFTSSATESNFLALWGYWLHQRKEGKKVKFLGSMLEHSSIRSNISFLQEAEGVEFDEIPLKKCGEVDLAALEKKLQSGEHWLCSLYAACNESGVIYPWREIAKLCKEAQVPFHCDMVQLLGREKIEFGDERPSSMTFAFHKSGGLKAVGLLAVQAETPWTPMLRGGGQEKRRRGGTENLMGIASVDAFFDELDSIVETYQSKVRPLRDEFETALAKRIPSAKIVGADLNRLPNTSYVVFPGVAADEMLMTLDIKNICASAGSACTSGLSEASAPLMSLGFSKEDASSAIRFSLGESSTSEQIPVVLDAVESLLKKKGRIRFEAA